MEASKNDRLVKKFAALEDKTWFPQELLELVKDVCRLQSEVRASLAVSVDPALVCGDMEHRQGAPLLAREQFPVDAEGAEKLFRAILEVAESLPQLRTTAQLVRDKLIRGDFRPEELCSYCRTTFRAKRIQCPFCLEEDAKKLDYFTTENEPGYQVHVCRSCKSYIKIADFREFFGRESIPALDDLESLPLDIAAQNEDFHRVAPSEWGL